MSFAGKRMKLEAIILRKLTQEQETKYHMFSLEWELNDENTWTHREEQHTEAFLGVGGRRESFREND